MIGVRRSVSFIDTFETESIAFEVLKRHGIRIEVMAQVYNVMPCTVFCAKKESSNSLSKFRSREFANSNSTSQGTASQADNRAHARLAVGLHRAERVNAQLHQIIAREEDANTRCMTRTKAHNVSLYSCVCRCVSVCICMYALLYASVRYRVLPGHQAECKSPTTAPRRSKRP